MWLQPDETDNTKKDEFLMEEETKINECLSPLRNMPMEEVLEETPVGVDYGILENGLFPLQLKSGFGVTSVFLHRRRHQYSSLHEVMYWVVVCGYCRVTPGRCCWILWVI